MQSRHPGNPRSTERRTAGSPRHVRQSRGRRRAVADGRRRTTRTRASAASTEINAGNVKNLKLAWTFSTGVLRGQEAAPLVVGNTMYVVTPFPNIVYALDLTKPGAPIEVDVQAEARGRGAGRRVLRRRESRRASTTTARSSSTRSTTTPSRVDAETGNEVWHTKLGDINRGETITMAPLVVKGKVLVGNSGGELGVRGWLTALDASDRQDRVARVSHRPRQGRADRPELQAVLRRSRSGKDLGVSARGRPTSGRSAAARCGAGSPTTPSSI